MKKFKITLVKVKQVFLKFKDLEDSNRSKYELLKLWNFYPLLWGVGSILDSLIRIQNLYTLHRQWRFWTFFFSLFRRGKKCYGHGTYHPMELWVRLGMSLYGTVPVPSKLQVISTGTMVPLIMWCSISSPNWNRKRKHENGEISGSITIVKQQ